MAGEPELIQKAAAGDGAAFEALTAPRLAELESFAYRLIAHPDEQADLVQEALLEAHQSLAEFPTGTPFRTWLFAILARHVLDHLGARRQWGARSYQVGMAKALESDADQQALRGVLSSEDFELDIAQHIAFCFACVGRSLAPHQAVAVTLHGIFDFSVEDVAIVLGTDLALAEALVAEGGDALAEIYEGLCGLQDSEADCTLCLDLHRVTAPEGALPEVPLAGDSGSPFERRLRIVKAADLTGGSSRVLHDFLLRGLTRQEEGRVAADRGD